MLKIKSAFSMLLAFSMSISSITSLVVGANEHPTYGRGLAPERIEERAEIKMRNDDWPYSNVTVLSNIDLSTDGYFPPIGNQGQYESCASWAITYYQFTHEVHKLNNITTTSLNAYSPRWTYNFLNGGSDTLTTASGTYNVLTRQGAVTMSEYPYNVSQSNFFKWLNNETAMLNALSTKVVNDDEVCINGGDANNKITSVTDSKLIKVKQLLCAGKVVTVPTKVTVNATNYSVKYTVNGEKAVYRASNSGAGHLMTVVGYDNTVECDVNNDGIIQECEKGAFKVANSWGTDYGNNGYIWVMYDALNTVSANTTNNWETNEPGNRKPIFDNMGYNKNQFYYMDVANQTVNLAGVINFTTSNTNSTTFKTKRGTTSPTQENIVLYQSGSLYTRSYSGALVLDFGSLDDNIISYLSGYNWYASVSNNSNYPMQNISYKIVDNKGNTIKNAGIVSYNLGSGTNGDYPITLNMQLGDVNYSGSITGEDQNQVLQYVIENAVPSNMQRILADYNQDGVINIMDVIAIGNAAIRCGNGLSEDIDMDLIAELYRQYAEANGMSEELNIYEILGVENHLDM